MLKVYPNGFGDDFVAAFKEKHQKHCLAVLRAADLFLEGKVEIFGIESDLDDLLRDIDPTTGEKWPQLPYKDYRFHAGAAPADVKFFWEYMKHYFLVDAGKAYLLTKDEKYVVKSREFMERWMEKTHFGIGVSWIGHVHICQRMLSWFSWLNLTKGSQVLDDGFYRRVDQYLREQEELLSSEYENPRNNHKLVSIMTVCLCHLHSGREEGLDIWMERLRETTNQLIFRDGGFIEQSTSYHRLCVEALLVLGIALQNHGLEVPDFILDGIERSLNYFAALLAPGGTLPIVGDNSNEILIHRANDFWAMEYLFHLAAFLGITVKSLCSEDSEALFYLGSSTEVEEPFKCSGSFSFPDVGHYVIKDEKNYAFLRAGQFGMYYSEQDRSGHPHSHCDQLGVVLYLDGLEVLTDPGTYRYNQSDFERRIMKDESYHSTFLVDDVHQGIYTSSFSYAHTVDGNGRANGRTIIGELEIGGVKAVRKVTLNQGECEVEDEYRILDGREHQLQIFFCLSPRFTPVEVDQTQVLLQHIGTRKYLALKHDLGLMPEVYPGYVSREYNQAEPNQRLAFKTTLKQDLKVNFKFRFVSKD